jgi:hypothetical protein
MLFYSISICNETAEFVNNYNYINKNGMLVLGSWAVGNILVGGIGRTKSNGEAKYFHEMNAAWNMINLSIAGFGLYNSFNFDPLLNTSQAILEQKKIENFLLFNAGLDIAYLGIGFYLKERAKTSKYSERLIGYGNSLLLQGAFLFLFDLTLYYFHDDLSFNFISNIESIQIGLNGIRINF